MKEASLRQFRGLSIISFLVESKQEKVRLPLMRNFLWKFLTEQSWGQTLKLQPTYKDCQVAAWFGGEVLISFWDLLKTGKCHWNLRNTRSRVRKGAFPAIKKTGIESNRLSRVSPKNEEWKNEAPFRTRGLPNENQKMERSPKLESRRFQRRWKVKWMKMAG